MRKGAFLLAYLFLLVSMFGCKSEGIFQGGTPPPAFYKTVVSLSPGATEILGTCMPQLTLVGRTAECNFPNPNSPAEIVMNGVKPNYEKIAQLRPQVVLYDDQLFSQADIDKLKALKIDTYAVSGNTVNEFQENLYVLASKLHGESVTSEYVDRIHNAAAAAAGAPPARQLKVAVLIPGKGSEHMIAGTKSFVADEISLAQGVPVGPDADRFVPVSAESLVSLNPDVIVSAGDASPILNDPRLKSIAAIGKKRVLAVDPAIALRRGGRVDKFIRGVYAYFATVAQEGQTP